ncbi:MAG: SDR family NAD(P)-dependent oxidoreductase [Rhodospirillales bacterium]|nr:SDR family NAD(P)-dependent oxidoreductase [Rhodospirillales bacterium]
MFLKGKTALVTGATGGLGVAECTGLAAEGADVLMLDIKGEKVVGEIAAHQPRSHPLLCLDQDRSKPNILPQAERAIRKLIDKQIKDPVHDRSDACGHSQRRKLSARHHRKRGSSGTTTYHTS